MPEMTHFDPDGNARMVDVGSKPASNRVAIATGVVKVLPATMKQIRSGTNRKGDVLGVARLAGIMAAKQTPNLVPLCHGIALTSVQVDFDTDDERKVQIRATARATDRTGVEMEALTAVSVAALVIYDMCKSVDREMEITDIRLLKKTGGVSGDFHLPNKN